jgi:hypothetical protein
VSALGHRGRRSCLSPLELHVERPMGCRLWDVGVTFLMPQVRRVSPVSYEVDVSVTSNVTGLAVCSLTRNLDLIYILRAGRGSGGGALKRPPPAQLHLLDDLDPMS